MSRYIDADAFERRCMFDPKIEDMQDVIYALRDYPTADVVPAVHAQWKYWDGNDTHRCSRCRGLSINTYPHCPWCGAKMDELT